ncbi:MAG: hypothetical protein AAGL89_05960 [Pseudomonadota bacterium]
MRFILLAGLTAIAGPASAWECALTLQDCFDNCDKMQVRFEIDDSQFAPPINPNDPPRRQVTLVEMDGARFAAEALKMGGGIEGFYEEAGELGSRLMIVQPNGSARLSLRPINEVWTGQCSE